MSRINSRSARAARGEQLPRARRRKSRKVSSRLAHMNRNLEYAGKAPRGTLTQARKDWKDVPRHQRLNAIKARRNDEAKAQEQRSEEA